MGDITRSAVGRHGRLGSFYDARTDQFVTLSLLKSLVPDDIIDSTDRGGSQIEFVRSDGSTEDFSKFDINGELELSILCGLVKVGGSGAYLTEEKKTSKSMRMTLLYKVNTVHEEAFLPGFKPLLDMDSLQDFKNLSATHIVTQISWGATCSVTCEYMNKENYDSHEVHGKMTAELKKLKSFLDVKGKVDLDIEKKENNLSNTFTFTSRCDVAFSDVPIPTTFEEAVGMAKSLPEQITKTNNGKGVPMMFTLTPIDQLFKMCRVQIQANIISRALTEETICRSLRLLHDVQKLVLQAGDVKQEMQDSSRFLSRQRCDEADQLYNDCRVFACQVNAGMQKILKETRSGIGELSDLDGKIEPMFQKMSTFSSRLRGFDKDKANLELLSKWISEGIKVIGYMESIDFLSHEHIYILRMCIPSMDSSLFEDTSSMFRKFHAKFKSMTNYLFIAKVENDNTTSVKMSYFVNGQQRESDVYAKNIEELKMCLVDISASSQHNFRPSRSVTILKLGCANSFSDDGSCSKDEIQWICKTCHEWPEYDLTNKKIFCKKCGLGCDPQLAKFRCNGPRHGLDFKSFPPQHLWGELSKLKELDEVTFLILGESGVGKSTWVNAFVNYARFSTLEDSVKSKSFTTLIPSRFKMTYNDVDWDIKVGEDTSGCENMEAGASATQEPKSYLFNLGDKKIRLIDTPGIGDTRGIDQDKKNFDKILQHISYHERINGVCILMKPNEARIGVVLKFCIQELLSHLDSSAKNNIMFCFTKCRETFYQPGETKTLLNKMLDEKNIGIKADKNTCYCFDSEAFRLLAAQKNGVEFTNEEIKLYAESWNKSRKVVEKMIADAESIEPHLTKETLSMNEARKTIIELSKPMAEAGQLIQKNIQNMEDAKRQIQACEGDISAKARKLFETIYLLKHVPLSKPRTVCTNKSCVGHKSATGSVNGVQQEVYYKTLCHSPCSLTGIPSGTPGEPGLVNCWCVQKNGDCRVCGHHWSQHMHIQYELQEVSEQRENESVRRDIDAKTRSKGEKQSYLASVESQIREMTEEKNKILRISAEFTIFLKKRSLLPYNDATEDYLKYMIKMEADKDRSIRDDRKLESLQMMLAQYLSQKDILDRNLESCGQAKTPDDIAKLKTELFAMKHFGKMLKDIFNGVQDDGLKNMRFQEQVVHVPNSYFERAKKKVKDFVSW